MAKRKNKRRQTISQENPNSSSDSETAHERPSKKVKIQNTPYSRYRSTPYTTHSSSVKQPSSSQSNPSTMLLKHSVSNAVEDNSFQNDDTVSFVGSHDESIKSYASFSSFLHTHSFVADEEDDLLTVSQLAEQRVDTPNRVSQCVTANTSKVHQDATMDLLEEDMQRSVLAVNNYTEIVILQHPSWLTLKGFVKITVLAGSVSVFGYDVKEKEHVNVLSNQYAGFNNITTKKSVHKRSTKNLHKEIRNILGKREGIEDFLEGIGSSSIVVLIEKSMLPSNLQFVELYYPHFLGPKNASYSEDKCSVIEIDAHMKSVATEIEKAIHLSVGSDNGPKLLVHGPKDSGKSSMLRYLINTVLNMHSAVYYLDTDPGQSEFTPPGVLSLTRVTHPILGPPFCNNTKPLRMVFIGSDTPATSPAMYVKSVRKLIEYFNTNFKKEILLVNTMGWVEGIGDDCFQSIKSVLKPTMLLQFVSPAICPDLKIECVEDCSLIQIPKKNYTGERYSRKYLKIYALMSYLGKCQKFYMQPTYINEFRPVCVCWDNIAIYLMGKKVPPHRLVEAIHCSIVALCHVSETLELKNEANTAYPRTLENDPDNECLGFGLVRASDEVNHLLYIVTPLTLKELKNVNALIKGNTMIPDEVFLKQPILNTPLPFTDQPNTAPAFNRKSIKKRQFKPNQTPKVQ